jgi:hypothetical protein
LSPKDWRHVEDGRGCSSSATVGIGIGEVGVRFDIRAIPADLPKGEWKRIVTGSSEADAEADLGLVLEDGERVVARLAGFGASIVVTMQRLVVVRDRAGFRPRSGVRSWRHEAVHGISLSPPMRGQARIVVRAGSGPDSEVSMFFAAEHWPEAARIVGEVRRLAGLDGTHS